MKKFNISSSLEGPSLLNAAKRKEKINRSSAGQTTNKSLKKGNKFIRKTVHMNKSSKGEKFRFRGAKFQYLTKVQKDKFLEWHTIIRIKVKIEKV